MSCSNCGGIGWVPVFTPTHDFWQRCGCNVEVVSDLDSAVASERWEALEKHLASDLERLVAAERQVALDKRVADLSPAPPPDTPAP